MTEKPDTWQINRSIGRFKGDRRALVLLVLLAIGVAAWGWLESNPHYNPWAPLDLRDPVGPATASKLAALKDDPELCRAVLDESNVSYTVLEPAGEGPCLRDDRTQLTDYPLNPATPAATCPVAAALAMWRTKTLDPAAQEIFGSEIAQIQHYGTYACRRLYWRDDGPWSEHATGNAIDISGFVLADGRQISVLNDWDGDEDEQRFLRRVRDGACQVFATALSPDYNAQHADHFHFDQAGSWSGVCR